MVLWLVFRILKTSDVGFSEKAATVKPQIELGMPNADSVGYRIELPYRVNFQCPTMIYSTASTLTLMIYNSRSSVKSCLHDPPFLLVYELLHRSEGRVDINKARNRERNKRDKY